MLERILRSAVAAVTSRPDTLLNIGWAVVIVTLLFFALEWFVGAPNRDSSAFIYVAQGILEGEVPYVDRWDHKGPVIYLLNATGLALLGMWGIWLIEAAFLIGTVWLAYIVVKENFGLAATPFPVAILAGYFLYFAQGGNFTEQYALLFQFLALYLFVCIINSNGGRGRYALYLVSIGALAAAAFLLRPNLAGLWVAIGIYWIFIDRHDAVKRVLWSMAGAALAFLPVVGIFAFVGGLSAFWDAAFIYNFAYSDVTLFERLRAMRHSGTSALPFILFPIIAAWCGGLYYFLFAEGNRSERFESVLKLALILLPVEILFVSASANEYGHYYLAMLPVITMLTAFFAYSMFKVLSPSLPRYFLSVILLLGVVCYYLTAQFNEVGPIVQKYTHQDGIMRGKHMRVSELVRDATEPGDTILVWGAETGLYLLSERDAPTRFFYQYPLALRGYADSRIFDEFTYDVKEGRPALIIDTRNNRLPPLDDAERANWKIAGDRYVYAPDRFRPFLDFVEEEYEFMEEIEGYAIYQRVERSPG